MRGFSRLPGQHSAAFWATLQGNGFQLEKDLCQPRGQELYRLVKCYELVQSGLEELVFAKGGSQIGSDIVSTGRSLFWGTGINLSQTRQQKFIVTEWGALPILVSRTFRQE